MTDTPTPATDTVQSATSTETLVRLLVAIARADDAVRKKHDLIFVQAADRLSTLQSELTRAREREKELVEALKAAKAALKPINWR